MKKTLALLLAAALLYLTPFPPVSIKSQTLVASSKFLKVANPIPNRYIVVLATTNLNPISSPSTTPFGETTRNTSTSEDSEAFSDPGAEFESAQPKPTDPDVTATATELTTAHGGTFTTTWSAALKGFLLHASESQAQSMSQDSRVAFIVEDGAISVGTPDTDPIVMTPDPGSFMNPQPRASWGLDRINQRYLPLDELYGYVNDGAGVNAYVIDTGILTTHWEFSDRAVSVYDVFQGNGIDCNGHGSHVAGIIGGRTFGVAKNVRLLSVRVLNCQGSGSWADVIDGVDFVTWHRGQPNQQGVPAVANMSLGGSTNRAVEVAVRNSIRANVTYIVAAGNGNTDAGTYSPAGVVEAITVGATDRLDFRADFSNFGASLDLFAPGVGIPSAWIGGDLMIATATGTSMSSPHVAGVAALYLQSNRSASPAAVRAALVDNATVGVIARPGEASPNRLLFTNY